MVVELRGKKGGEASWHFQEVTARPFLTIEVSISPHDLNPTATILRALSRREKEIRGGIVRVQLTLPEHSQGLVQEQEIHRALREAQYSTLLKEVVHRQRPRLGDYFAGKIEQLSPLEALRKYLELKETPPEKKRKLLEYGERLIAGSEAED
jgi:hypothetical protein